MFNKKIRTYAKEKNVYLWQIADELNITDGNFSRKLRRELPEKEQKEVILCCDSSIKDFYEKLGFTVAGEWVLLNGNKYR